MSNPFEFVLPPRPEPHSDPEVYPAHVGVAVRAAITEQKARLVFPSLQRFAAHFALEPSLAGVLRRALVGSGHLARLGNEYFTTHPACDATTAAEVP